MAVDGGLRGTFRDHIPHAHWQSIEAGAVGRGIPDSNYCLGGSEGWVEFKQTTGWVVKLRPEQVAWLLRRARAGGRVWVAVRQRGMDRDSLWLFSGAHADEVLASGLTVEWAVGMWHGGPARWDWTAIERLLTG